MSAKIRVGIIGGAGYTGGEMLRLLLLHPQVDIVFVHSKSQAGKPVYATHKDLLGLSDMRFSSETDWAIDALFLCVGHGDARRFLQETPLPEHIKVIDLSQDFRHNERNSIENRRFVYGLPELNRAAIQAAANIANPGCFATCIQLALLPLAKAGLLQTDVHVSAATGSTGAGQSLSETSHFSWRHSNLSVYKLFEHQHLKEIGQSLHQLQNDWDTSIHFVPYRAAFARGILATTYTRFEGDLEDARRLYADYYADHPFTHVAPFEVDVKQVVNTNQCYLQLAKVGEQLAVVSAIDNLLKGASGQAVQNMNLLFGLPEDTGLRLKAIGF